MTSRERSARTKFYAVAAAAAALASLALVGTLGLKSNRREPNRGAAAPPPSRPTAGIVGGGDAPATEFPWMVTLYDGDHPDDSWDGHFCGGSLIAPTAILTAAHCVEGGAKPKAVVGAYNFSRSDAGGASYTPERHTVKDVFIHPQYDGNFYDVAVLRLETPSALPPLRIADASPALGTNVTVIGWGQTTAVPGYDWRDDDISTHFWDDDIWPGWWDDDSPYDDDVWYFEWYDDDYDGGPAPNVVLCPGFPAWASCDCDVPCGDQPTFCPCAEAVACCNGAAPSSGDDAGAEPMNRKKKLLRRHRAKGKKAPRPAPSKAKQAKPRRHAGRGHARPPKIAPGDDAAPSYKPSARPSYEQSSGTTAWDSGHGFCSSNLDGLVYAATRDDCWAACEATYGSIVAVDYWGQGYCYCQDDCQCMISDHGVDLFTVDSISELPDACEYDDDYGWDYDDDYSYDFSSYGYNDDWYVDDDYPDVLQLVEVAVRDPEDCVLEYLPGFDICAGDPPAEDSCYGDSGGPLLVREGDAWAQVGVVSRGEGCAAFPGLYADATALREWILTSAGFEGRATPQPSARPIAPPPPPPRPPPTTQEPSPTPRPVALDSAPQPTTRPTTQESSPTSRPTEPSATPDEPLGLPEDSATAAPTTESDGALGRRLARAAVAACALAALLLSSSGTDPPPSFGTPSRSSF